VAGRRHACGGPRHRLTTRAGARQVPELLVGVPAPVLYWEQGHEWLFGDPVRFQACARRAPSRMSQGKCHVRM